MNYDNGEWEYKEDPFRFTDESFREEMEKHGYALASRLGPVPTSFEIELWQRIRDGEESEYCVRIGTLHKWQTVWISDLPNMIELTSKLATIALAAMHTMERR